MINSSPFLFLILFIFLSLNGFSQRTNAVEKYQKVSIQLNDEQDIRRFQEQGIDFHCGAERHGNSITLVLSESELFNLKVSVPHLKTKTIIADLAQDTERRLATDLPKALAQIEAAKLLKNSRNIGQRQGCDHLNTPIPSQFNLGSMGGFTTYQEMLDNLDKMAARYPGLITVKKPISSTLLTHEGRPVFYVKISDNPEASEDEPEVLYTGIHHAREPVSMMSQLYFMWHLLENYHLNPEIKILLDNSQLYFIPVLNPDGYFYNEATNPKGGGYWRKNRSPHFEGPIGTDLNRNYDFNWGLNNTGSSSNPASEVFRGTSPFSEAETQMVRDFVGEHDFKTISNNHTYSELLLHPYGTSHSLPQEDEKLFHAMSEQMCWHNRFIYGPSYEVIYATNGDADDWHYGEQTTKNKAYAFTPEFGSSKEGGFWPNPSHIVSQCQKGVRIFYLLAYYAMNYAVLYDNTSLNVRQSDLRLSFAVERIVVGSGVFHLRIHPISDNIKTVQSPILTTAKLVGHDYSNLSTAYTLNEEIQPGDLIEFEVSLNNGIHDLFTTRIKKYYELNPLLASTAESSEQDWNGNWVQSNDEVYGGFQSYTDHDGLHTQGTRELKYSKPINLSGSNYAYLEYFTKYFIQRQYDYVAVEVSTNGIQWTPICTDNSKPGSHAEISSNPNSQQPPGSAIYDGRQQNWIRQEIDLSAYWNSTSLRLRFISFISPTRPHEKGFFVDNISLFTDQFTHCEDGLLNADEVDVDCGGLTCEACPNCEDGIMNGDETDVDCGGIVCLPCENVNCTKINFNNFPIENIPKDRIGYQILHDGATLLVEHNSWVAVDIPTRISNQSTLEFDFKSPKQGERHEVFFSNDLNFSQTSDRFQIYGTAPFTTANQEFKYTDEGVYQHVSLPIGKKKAGNFRYLIFSADDDATAQGKSIITNLIVFEDIDGSGNCERDRTCMSESIVFSDFEQGFGMWEDGGLNCHIDPADAEFANSGTNCIALIGSTPSSQVSISNPAFDQFNYFDISYNFISKDVTSIDGKLSLQIIREEGLSYQTIHEIRLLNGFQNLERQFIQTRFFGNLSSTSKIRLITHQVNPDATMFIDDVHIEGCRNDLIEIKKQDNLDIRTFPNPIESGNSLLVALPYTEEVIQYKLYNNLGQLIRAEHRELEIPEFHIDLIDLSPGLYLLKVLLGIHEIAEPLIIL